MVANSPLNLEIKINIIIAKCLDTVFNITKGMIFCTVERIKTFNHLKSWITEMYQMCPGIAPSLIIKDLCVKNNEKGVLEEIKTRPKTITIEAVA